VRRCLRPARVGGGIHATDIGALGLQGSGGFREDWNMHVEDWNMHVEASARTGTCMLRQTGAMTQIGAIGGAAAAGCGGGSGVGARAGRRRAACGWGGCAAHIYTNRTHLRFLPVSPSSLESEKPLCAIAWPVGVRPLPPCTNGALEAPLKDG